MLDEGYEVYIVDQWSVGRSSKTNLDAAALSPGSSVETAEIAFTAPERYNFYFQARFHTQWPGVSGVTQRALQTIRSPPICRGKNLTSRHTERNKRRSYL